MKRLENKVFYVLILILTIFLTTILFIANAQSYNREKINIENNLTKMGNPFKEVKKDKELQFDKENINFPNPENNGERKIFMDSIIYTIKFNDEKNITEVITHTENGVSNEEIKNIAYEILNKQNRKELKIGNLYFDKYSYAFKDNNQLIVLDNEHARQGLKNELRTSLILLAFLEAIIIYVANRLTKWIIKPAKEAMENQKRFIADASHELKTPVAVIMASSEALESDYQHKWIDNIKNETERMNELITSLLDLSKIENTDSKEQYTNCDFTNLVKKSCITFESLIFEKNINFISNIDENVNLVCDTNQIKQLISIIIDNAIKHSDQNGEIVVNLQKQKNEIVLEIKNKGKAIPDELKEKIFERFYRADESRNRNDNRYGLGLAIAKSIVMNHNGKITVESKDGYTTFKICFKKM